MKYIDDDVLGGQSRPIHNNFELTNAMQGRKNYIQLVLFKLIIKIILN
jgi:hypothetical protein